MLVVVIGNVVIIVVVVIVIVIGDIVVDHRAQVVLPTAVGDRH